MADLDKLFMDRDHPLDAGQVNAFWDNLTAQSAGESPSPEGILSYEQARTMGLTP
jgi:hypothetical protein